MLVFGLLLMVLMIFRPQGLLTVPGRRDQEPAAGELQPATDDG